MSNEINSFNINTYDPAEPIVALIGSSLQFSDRILRVLRMEYAGVHFERFQDAHDLLDSGLSTKVVVVHESVPDVEGQIARIRTDTTGSMIALACNDEALVLRINRSNMYPPVSALQMNAEFDVWFAVLRLLLCGHAYVPVEFSRKLNDGGEPQPVTPMAQDLDVQFTPREMDILPLIAEGKQNKMIAGELGLSLHTVKLHTRNIFSKLNVSNRTGAANWYLSHAEGKADVDPHIHAK